MRPITVTVDGTPYRLIAGAEVWMLYDQLPEPMGSALKAGLARMLDVYGNEVGSGGGLADGQALRVVYVA